MLSILPTSPALALWSSSTLKPSCTVNASAGVAILPAQKAVTLDDCFTFFKFYPQNGGDFQYLNDGRHFVVADGDGLHIRDVLRPDKDSLFALQLTEAVKDYDLFDFNSDETRLLLRTATEPVYRHSVLAN